MQHSGHGSASGSGSVKNEKIEETDAPQSAEDPIQANRSESDEEDRKPPVRNDTISERKRKSSAASSASTTLPSKTRKKVKADKDTSTQRSKRRSFDERCNQLLRFKDEFGHCNVPHRYNTALGQWCSNMRNAYKKIQKGTKTNSNLSQDRIGRLEEIGFQWYVLRTDLDEAFEQHCRELIAFKEEFGHCNVPRSYAGNPSLGHWCHSMINAYKKIQKGMKTNSNLSQDRIERLTEIGFQWKIYVTFEKRCRELIAFKEEFGHCYVPRSYADNPSLGHWCNVMINSYNKIQKGMKTNSNLSQGRIERLEEIGFQWQVLTDYDKAFEKRCRELISFKEEFGHCNVPTSYANNPSLGKWCSNKRTAHNKIQKGVNTNSNLSQGRIERLEEIGFQWKVRIPKCCTRVNNTIY